MFIGILKITIFISDAQSLKDKRKVLRRLRDILRNKFNISIAEVGDLNLWQRATLGIAIVGNDAGFTDSVVNSIAQLIRAENNCEIINEIRETISIGNFV